MRGKVSLKDGSIANQNLDSANDSFVKGAKMVLYQFDKDVLFISDFSEVTLLETVSYQVLILDGEQVDASIKFLNLLRSSNYERIYLKPVFLLYQQPVKVSPILEELADGVLASTSIEPYLLLIDKILSTVDKFDQIETSFQGSGVLLKLLRYYYSRGRNIQAIPSSTSHTGYIYPVLEAHFGAEQFVIQRQLLDAAFEQKWIWRDYMDKVHLCHSCHSGFINYREVCPKCGHSDLKVEPSVHHFSCGHIAPLSAFKAAEKHVCPKCAKPLKHIGIDHDQPTQTAVCLACQHSFQESSIQTYCYHCGETAGIEDLKEYSVYHYSLTPAGIKAITSGVVKVNADTDVPEGFISYAVFKTILKLEVQRANSLGLESTLSSVRFIFSPDTIDKLGEGVDQISKELSLYIQRNLPTEEVICMLEDKCYLILSPASQVDKVKASLASLLSSTQFLMEDVIGKDVDNRILTQSYRVSADTDYQELVNSIHQHTRVK